MRLQGKKALVTGTAQGLGQHMALALAAEGCDVAGFDIRAEQLVDTTERIQALGRQAIGWEVDVRDYDAVQAAVARLYAEWGQLDILVNNAGKGQREKFTDLTKDVWDYMLAVNLTSAFNLCHAVIPRMLAQGVEGRIVNISSLAATSGGRVLGKSAYAAAKGGIISLTKALAIELAPHKITVNCVSPGVHNTPRRANDSPEEQKLIMDNIPMKELGEPADLAQTVVFLCLPSSRYITGITLPQDGGHSI
jgi:NAD(P)-dependent dehydrogenase (short-subunit alcohol dehydrogenase family)